MDANEAQQCSEQVEIYLFLFKQQGRKDVTIEQFENLHAVQKPSNSPYLKPDVLWRATKMNRGQLPSRDIKLLLAML